MMLYVLNVSTRLWDQFDLSFVNLTNAWISRRFVRIPNKSNGEYVQGVITSIKLESGAEMGTTPRHLLIKVGLGEEFYVHANA